MLRNASATSLKQLHANWGWYLALGIGLIILGSLALIYSFTSTLFAVEYIGFMLTIAGVIEAIQAFKLNKWDAFFLHIFLAVLYIASGLFIIFYPMLNAVTLTLALAFFFIASGIAKIYFAYTKRIPHKNWLLFNGVLTIILGGLIWWHWPISSFWILGTLLGIDTIVAGWTVIMLALMAKDVKA
jgi:uncharacterized membrane protein HdeD (DUF308 family)